MNPDFAEMLDALSESGHPGARAILRTSLSWKDRAELALAQLVDRPFRLLSTPLGRRRGSHNT
jgi:hypothetical protein